MDTLPGLSASELMSVWERGSSLELHDRAVLLLAQSLALPVSEAACVNIAQRDQHLLRLRCATLGTRIETLLPCEECGEELEFTLDARQLITPLDKVNADPEQLPEFVMRPPDTTDLHAAAHLARSPEEARRILYRRCVCNAGLDHEMEPTESMLLAYSDWLTANFPDIEIQLEIDCTSCGAQRVIAFEIVSFFWREIELTCARLVREVDALARTYGWSEQAILSMTSARRRQYLEAASA